MDLRWLASIVAGDGGSAIRTFATAAWDSVRGRGCMRTVWVVRRDGDRFGWECEAVLIADVDVALCGFAEEWFDGGRSCVAFAMA